MEGLSGKLKGEKFCRKPFSSLNSNCLAHPTQIFYHCQGKNELNYDEFLHIMKKKMDRG